MSISKLPSSSSLTDKRGYSRNVNADIIRLFALFCVVSFHFFKKIRFNELQFVGFRMFAVTMVYSFFVICVPLFLLLTGSLMNRKRWDRTYYKRINKTISIYLLYGLAMIAFYYFYRGSTDIFAGILDMLSFDKTYAWYVEMYLGLFVLIPFLNILYHAIPTQRKKQALLLTLFSLCSFPYVINVWNVTSLSWWKQPAVSDNYHQLIPDYWIALWPLLYYFLGCYLCEYPLKISRKKTLLLIVFVCVLFGAFCFYRSYGSEFILEKWAGYQSPFTLVLSILVFHFLNGLNCDRIGTMPRRVLAKLSDWAFGAYLCSYIFDELFYSILRRNELDILHRFKYYFLLVPVCYIGSLLLSAVLNFISSLISKVFSAKT